MRRATATAIRCQPLRHALPSPFPLATKRHSHNHSVGIEYSSPISTLTFQSSLPRLPIPPLHETTSRLAQTLLPLAESEALFCGVDVQSATVEMLEAVERFNSLEGVALNEELVALDENNLQTSFISGMWFDMYLRGRWSLPLNSNPYIPFKSDPRCENLPSQSNASGAENNAQIARATSLIAASLRFHRALKSGNLQPDAIHSAQNKNRFPDWVQTAIKYAPESMATALAVRGGSVPLDMSQYGRLFSSTRIPHEVKDELVSFEGSRHVVVIRNGEFYQVDVMDEHGNPLSAEAIRDKLLAVQALSVRSTEQGAGIGLLTSEDRTTWARNRKLLLEAGEQSKVSLRAIDSALFVVCLDHAGPPQADENAIQRAFLQGQGRSRWWDKSFSLIVLPNGHSAVNFEHSWGDGVAVLRYMTDVFYDARQSEDASWEAASITEQQAIEARAAVKHLSWSLNDAVQDALTNAEKIFNTGVSAIDLSHATLSEMGARDCKILGLSPDGVAQMAYQIAYYRMFGRTVSTYESASTASFKHGRTEVIRPVSSASVALTAAFAQGSTASPQEKHELLQLALAWHKLQAQRCKSGDGIDRHLYALERLAEERGWSGDRALKLFTLPAYKSLQKNVLSTSTVVSGAITAGGFGAVTADGFGIGYVYGPDALEMNVTSYIGRSSEFTMNVGVALADIADSTRQAKKA